MGPESYDLQAWVAKLAIYPVKSCAGIDVREITLCKTGTQFDREWAVVDFSGTFVSQREAPRMALVSPELRSQHLVLRAPDMAPLLLELSHRGSAMQVGIWNDTVQAYDMGDEAALWLGKFLDRELRLVRFDPESRRLASPQWTGDTEAPILFSDGFPLLITSEASLESLNDRLEAIGEKGVGMSRFRPNIVLGGIEAHDEDSLDVIHVAVEDRSVQLQPVKPCSRCQIPNVDPATGEYRTAVTDMLATYRRNARLDGAVTFGVNALVLHGAGQMLRTGQSVYANYRF